MFSVPIWIMCDDNGRNASEHAGRRANSAMQQLLLQATKTASKKDAKHATNARTKNTQRRATIGNGKQSMVYWDDPAGID